MDFHSAMHGVAPVALGAPLPPKRVRTAAKNLDTRPLEKTVVSDVLKFLHLHPSVAFVGRFNRGKIVDVRNGKPHIYVMNTIPGFPDIHGMLKSGRPLYFEAKRQGENPTDVQQHFLDLAQRFGALTGVVRCVSDAIELLKDA